MKESSKGSGFFLRCVVFVGVAIPAFYFGMVLAAIPCFDSTPGSYCSAHGGGVIFAGLGLGLLLAIVSGTGCIRVLRKAPADDTASRGSHEA